MVLIGYIEPDSWNEAEAMKLKEALSNIKNFSAMVMPSYIKIEQINLNSDDDNVLQVWKCGECGALIDPRAKQTCPYCGGTFKK